MKKKAYIHELWEWDPFYRVAGVLLIFYFSVYWWCCTTVIWPGQSQRPVSTWIKGQKKNHFDLFLLVLSNQFYEEKKTNNTRVIFFFLPPISEIPIGTCACAWMVFNPVP